MSLIHVSCEDAEIIAAIRRALSAHCEVEPVLDYDLFSGNPSVAACRIQVLCMRSSAQSIGFLESLARYPGKPALQSAQPVMVVVGQGGPEWKVDRAAWKHIPNRTIAIEDFDELAWSGVQEESARATLETLRFWCENDVSLGPQLRSALRVALCIGQPVTSIRNDARLAGCSAKTLHQHWNKHGLDGMTLKDLVDRVLLLRVRAAKTPRLTWNDAAAEHGVTVERLHDVANRTIGHWPGDRDGDAWISAALELRSVLSTRLGAFR